jgi:hypothetical protein
MTLRVREATLAALAWILVPSPARAADLVIDGSAPGPIACPSGGSAVDRLCRVSPVPAQNNACSYGGTKTFDSVSLTNGATVCVRPYDGFDKVNTGNLILKAKSIVVDATSRITAKGSGYRGVLCGDGEGPSLAGGRGGCSVLDSGGGGAHVGPGGRGTKDCFLVAPTDSCQFPGEWEEDCGDLALGLGSCADAPDPNFPVCWGLFDTPDGGGNALPSVAGVPFTHSLYQIDFGAAGGDKGCRDGWDPLPTAGRGGGRIVLFAATDAGDGHLQLAGRVLADGFRGCASGNDSAGGGAGGTVLLIGDTVDILSTARVSAHGGRGGDSQPKCTPCGTAFDCQSGQACTAGRCAPCNCTPCNSNAQCDALLGQTCKGLGGALGSVCADAANQCTPFEPEETEVECAGTQNAGVCDDCGGGGGGGIITVQSGVGHVHPQAIFDVRGAGGGICPICAGESGGGAGELQIDGAYVGEVCDGWDNDFDGVADEGMGSLACPDGTSVPACISGVPQQCPPNPAVCLVQASDARPRFALIVDTSGSMLNDLAGQPTFGDGSIDHPGVDTGADPEVSPGDDSRLFIAKEALTQVLSAFPESDYALARYHQDVGVNRSCQSAQSFECQKVCCSYDDPTNNLPPLYPPSYPANKCVLSQLYPAAGYPATPAFTGNLPIGWNQEIAENPPTDDCINYAGSCGQPRRGGEVLVGFDQPIQRYLRWLDGVEDADAVFDAGTVEGDHCPSGNCELRGTGPTPLGGALQAMFDYLTPAIACDSAKSCRSYSTILLTDGAESCGGDPEAAAAALFAGVSGKAVKTYVVGFSVLASEQAELDQIAQAGGTGQAFFAATNDELADTLAAILAADQKFELCNDVDDDCDGLIDEDFPEKGLPCDDGGLGVCLGTGAYECTGDGSGTDCVITSPGASPSSEVCNGLDDDCDGYIDEGDDGAPLDCPSCTPSPEVCDAIDNDCDLAIDEEPDVSTNQPDLYGLPCGDLTPPNDQPPCHPGVVTCVNGAPICIGLVGPSPELCNGADDDCDGLADNEAQCPGESQCIEGQCAPPCDEGEFPCPPGLSCEAGYCVEAGGAGGSTGASGGSAGTGGTSGGGGAGATTASAATTAGAGGTNSDQVWGLATGGGGCATAGGRPATSAGWLAIAAIAAALGAARRRREEAR